MKLKKLIAWIIIISFFVGGAIALIDVMGVQEFFYSMCVFIVFGIVLWALIVVFE